MKKSILLVTATLLFAFALAACGEAEETLAPGFGTTEAGEDLGTDVVIPGATTVPTDTMETVPAEITLEPTDITAEVTEAATDTVGTTETLTTGIPVTSMKLDPGRISVLLDFEVHTNDQDLVGEVEDFVINLNSRRVQYVIIGAGGFLGLGEKEIAVPWGAFKLDVEDTANDQLGDDNDNFLILNMDEAALENAPDWDPAILPAFGEDIDDWDVDIRGYWQDFDIDVEVNEDEIGEDEEDVDDTDEITTTEELTGTEGTTVVAGGPLRGWVMAKDALGVHIVNEADGADVAVVEDIVISTKSGKILYVIVSYADADGDVLIPVPPAAFDLDAEGNSLVMTDADTVLLGAPRFGVDVFPHTLDRDWDVDVETYWRNLDIDVEVNEDEIGEDD
jgi:sporulation protein YlmC with PRC-barrel domain